MTSFTLFDCQQMFRHACAFADCADMAEAKFCHDTADIGWYITPAVVNSAFACEVYLKALLLFHETTSKKKHAIKELYEMLPAGTKEWIVQTTTYRNGGVWKDTFGFDKLDTISNAFVNWRYSYEHDWGESKVMRMDLGFLTAFRNALREACTQRFWGKTWEEFQ